MAAALSSRFLKGIASLQAVRSSRLASASVYQNGMVRYSSTIPSDSDTHDDFKPTQKVPSGSTDSLKDIVGNAMGIFGFSGEDYIGKLSFPPVQAVLVDDIEEEISKIGGPRVKGEFISLNTSVV